MGAGFRKVAARKKPPHKNPSKNTPLSPCYTLSLNPIPECARRPSTTHVSPRPPSQHASHVGITEARARGGGREPPGTQGARGWPGVGLGSGLTSPGPGPGSTLTAPGGAALTSFFRRLWCLSALRLTSIARALRRLSFFATSCVASLLVLPSSLRLFFGDPPREK